MKSNLMTVFGALILLQVSTFESRAVEDVPAILQEAEREANQLEDRHVRYRMMALAQIAKLNGKVGQPEQAREAIKTYLDLLHSPEYEAVIEDFDEAYREMAKVQLTPLQVGIGDLDGALKTVGTIETPGRKYFALLNIVEKLAEKGSIDKALAIASRIPSEEGEWKAQALERIAEAQAKAGKFAATRETLQSFDELKADNDDDRRFIQGIKTSTVWHIASEQAKRGEFTDALETVSSLEDRFQIRTLYNIAKLQAAQNDSDAAKQTLEKAIRMNQEFKVDVYFSSIVETQIEIGDLDGASQTITVHMKGA